MVLLAAAGLVTRRRRRS
ncbi:MAG: LPXTG cell wall anchor domain-containing protein [Planctomycetota bacterium]